MNKQEAIKMVSDLKEMCERNRHNGCVFCPIALDLGVCWFPVDGEPYMWDVEELRKGWFNEKDHKP